MSVRIRRLQAITIKMAVSSVKFELERRFKGEGFVLKKGNSGISDRRKRRPCCSANRILKECDLPELSSSRRDQKQLFAAVYSCLCSSSKYNRRTTKVQRLLFENDRLQGRRRHNDIKDGKFQITYASAEQALSASFLAILRDGDSSLRKNLSLIVVDECHTVDTW